MGERKIKIRKSFSILVYLALPFALREIYLARHYLLNPVLNANFSLIILVVISTFLFVKSLFSGTYDGVYMAAKFLFLIVGYSFSERTKVFRNKPTDKSQSNVLLIGALAASVAVLFGLDIWSGSGAYSTRPPSFFRGFGELAIFLIVMVNFGGSLLLVIMIALLSGSKTVLAAVGLAILLKHPVKSATAILLSILAGAMTEIPSDFATSSEALNQFRVSVLEFNLGSRGFLNRYEGTLALIEMTQQSPWVLILGASGADLFDVWPEYGAGYLYKVGGLTLFVLTVLYVWSAIGLTLSTLPIYAVLVGSAYSLSPIAFFMYGFFGPLIKRRNRVTTF